MSGTRNERVVCVGVHILDIHGRPIDEIPPGQGGMLVDEIRLSAAGTGAGTAIDLAKLGADVVTFGCVGTDESGDFVVELMRRRGVDPRVTRTTEAPTSATILPIRTNGDRPAFHVTGANAYLTTADVDRAVVESAAVLLLGGVDRMGDFLTEGAPTVAGWARTAGVATVLDLLDGRPSRRRDDIAALLPLIDHFLPNQEQLSDLFDAGGDPLVGAQCALEAGAGRVIVSLGPDGCLVVDADGDTHVPGRVVDVMDTTGCGDALDAGYIRGLTLGYDPIRAAELGVLAASLVATGLSSDAGIISLDDTLAAAGRFTVRPPQRA
jgi:sugar/nucleoside kinase (ribokinase family)